MCTKSCIAAQFNGRPKALPCDCGRYTLFQLPILSSRICYSSMTRRCWRQIRQMGGNALDNQGLLPVIHFLRFSFGMQEFKCKSSIWVWRTKSICEARWLIEKCYRRDSLNGGSRKASEMRSSLFFMAVLSMEGLLSSRCFLHWTILWRNPKIKPGVLNMAAG